MGEIKYVLDLFCSATGMVISIYKSCSLKNSFSEDNSITLATYLPYPIKPLREGFKHFGFNLKFLSYMYEDKLWLYKKVEARISC